MIHTSAQLQPDGRTNITLMTPPSIKRDLAELFELVDEAYKNGKKGAIFAQIEEKMIRVTFCPSDIAERIVKAVQQDSAGSAP